MQRPLSRLRPWRYFALLVCVLGMGRLAHADELAEVQRLYYSGQATLAMDRADQYIAIHPTDPQMRFTKGVMLADAKRNAEAIAVFEQLNQDYPDIPEPYNNLAALYASDGDYDKARGTLEQALRTNPTYATAHENLGDVYAALAAQSYQRALKFDPRSVTVPPKLERVRALYKRADPAVGATLPEATAGQRPATPLP